MLIGSSVIKTKNISLWNRRELSIDSFGPSLGKVVFTGGVILENSVPMIPGELSVLVGNGVERTVSILQVWNDLSNLETVKMVWQHKWSDCDTKEILVASLLTGRCLS